MPLLQDRTNAFIVRVWCESNPGGTPPSDWRGSIIAEGQSWGKAKGIKLDWGRFADEWDTERDAGYAKLDDTATWLALADHVVDHGRSTADLPPSSYQAIVDYYLHLGYPLGSLVPLGPRHDGGPVNGVAECMEPAQGPQQQRPLQLVAPQ